MTETTNSPDLSGFDRGRAVGDAVKAAVVAFVALQLKEWFDSGRLDTSGTGSDALMVAGECWFWA